MIVNRHAIEQVFRNLNTLFNKAFDKAPSSWDKTAMLVNSNTAVEDYAWISLFPSLKEWVDEKIIKSLAAHDYSIRNKDWEATVAVRRNDIEDDNLGIYAPIAQDAGDSARVWPDRLVSELKLKAFTSPCYDKQYFYDGDHPVGNTTVSNMLTAPLSDATRALADASFGKARTMIMGFKDEQGDPMGLMPGLLEVPPALEVVARMLLENDKLADDTPNPYKNTVELLVNPWLKSDKQWFLHVVKLGVGGPYRATFEGCHLFTGQNQYNNKLYFNLAVETSAGRFEHFSFGSIETYFNMNYGEFWQGSGQVAGFSGMSTSYSSSVTYSSPAQTHIITIWGGLNSIGLSGLDLAWGDTTVTIYGNNYVDAPNLVSGAIIRYSMPGWNRDKAFLCNTKLIAETNTAAVGRTNEFMPPPMLLAGIPVMKLTPNVYSGVSVFAPAYIGAFSPLGNAYWGLIGQYPNQRICNLANNNPKDVVIYGTDEWMLFPLNSKGTTTYDGTWPVISGNYGVAYRK